MLKCLKIIYSFQKSRRRPWTSIGRHLFVLSSLLQCEITNLWPVPTPELCCPSSQILHLLGRCIYLLCIRYDEDAEKVIEGATNQSGKVGVESKVRLRKCA